MKALFTAIFCIFFGANVIPSEPDKDALEKLAAHIGKTFWSPPEKRLVRATTYPKVKDGSGSRKNISNATISLLRYATAKEAGTIAVPHWLPRGSMVKIQTVFMPTLPLITEAMWTIEKRHTHQEKQ
jgi:hypothetical protein